MSDGNAEMAHHEEVVNHLGALCAGESGQGRLARNLVSGPVMAYVQCNTPSFSPNRRAMPLPIVAPARAVQRLKRPSDGTEVAER